MSTLRIGEIVRIKAGWTNYHETRHSASHPAFADGQLVVIESIHDDFVGAMCIDRSLVIGIPQEWLIAVSKREQSEVLIAQIERTSHDKIGLMYAIAMADERLSHLRNRLLAIDSEQPHD